MLKANDLIENKVLREQCVGRVEVLDRVKKLLLIPDMEVVTLKQIADYYRVSIKTTEMCYKRNKNEIDSDGSAMKPPREFLLLQNVGVEKQKYKTILHLSDDVHIEIPNCGIRVFSKRAVLRFGMLLRDSAIAKEVRTQLLNVFETTTTEQKTVTLNEEEQLLMNFAKAYSNGDISEMLYASKNLMDFKNRHIKQLEQNNKDLKETNQALATDILIWEDRASFNKAVRIMAGLIGKEFALLYDEIYNELYYKYHIDVKTRNHGHKPYIENIREEEWSKVQKVLAALSPKYAINFAKVVRDSKTKIAKT